MTIYGVSDSKHDAYSKLPRDEKIQLIKDSGFFHGESEEDKRMLFQYYISISEWDVSKEIPEIDQASDISNQGLTSLLLQIDVMREGAQEVLEKAINHDPSIPWEPTGIWHRLDEFFAAMYHFNKLKDSKRV